MQVKVLITLAMVIVKINSVVYLACESSTDYETEYSEEYRLCHPRCPCRTCVSTEFLFLIHQVEESDIACGVLLDTEVLHDLVYASWKSFSQRKSEVFL